MTGHRFGFGVERFECRSQLKQDYCSGFSLITALLLVFLMASLALFLHFQVLAQWRMVDNVRSQLYSSVLAENGLEYARTVLPHLELDTLLVVLDCTHSGTEQNEWRNPMSFQAARNNDPAGWAPIFDDGLPFFDGQLLLPKGYAAEDGGYFFLRFSNNEQEAPDEDQDHIVLARSLGVVPSRMVDPFSPKKINHAILLEARLRQERSFYLPSPITLFGDSGLFQFEGTRFRVDGIDQPGVSVVTFSAPGLLGSFLASISLDQQECIQGGESLLSAVDSTALYLGEQAYQSLFRLNFWRHFQEQLPVFADGESGKLVYMPEGGVLDSRFAGVLVARGDLTVRGEGQIEGLLLHLGGGELALQDRGEVKGGIWMSNLETSGIMLQSLPLFLRVSGGARIRYSRRAIENALACFPPTQLGWRILFPEMQQ